MALHRDIFWIGRQWAVTGFGIQAINQKLGGEFDVAIDRLWDDDLLDVLRAQPWFNAEDFDKGLAVARTRHPQPPKPAAPVPVEVLLRASEVIPPVISSSSIMAAEPPERSAAGLEQTPKPPPAFPQLRIASHPARLLRVWRALRRR